MDLQFKTLDQMNLDDIISIRIQVLRDANKLKDDDDLSYLEVPLLKYYNECKNNEQHYSIYAFVENEFAGCGGVSFYTLLPTCDNPSGENAYIMNMYTEPKYRRKGIARRILDLLITEAMNRGITSIRLEATEAGSKLYLKHNFSYLKNEMELLIAKEN